MTEEASKQNVIDFPVIFMSVPEEETIKEPDNSSINDSESDNGGKPSKINSIPGFGLLGSLTCLYGGWKLRKK